MFNRKIENNEGKIENFKKFKKNKKKHILATPGLEPTTWSDDHSTTK